MSDAAYMEIITVSAYVGGYFGGYYEVFIDLATRKVSWCHNRREEEQETYCKTIREATVEKLLMELQSFNLLNWEAHYVQAEICDGTQWGIEIVTQTDTIKKSGDNSFPEEWDQFCSAVRKLTRKPFR